MGIGLERTKEDFYMTEEMRNDLTPQGYIRQMFRQTRDGKLAITRNPGVGEPETITYQVNWTAEDAEQIVQRYNLLTAALFRIGRLHDQLEEEENRIKLLNAEQLEIWNTYVRPYDPFEVDLTVVYDIYDRSQLGDILEEEEAIWKRYCMWREEQSQKRIPFHRRSAANMIQRARRYEKLISMDAPLIVVAEEGRCLAEEMVLYYAGKEEPIVWD
jgi:hypothetical protein